MSFEHRVEFPAWRDGDYVGLAEILVCLGRAALDLEWACQVDEAAPEPGNDELEKLSPEVRVPTLNLLSLVAPDHQVIDGRFDGYSRASGEMVVSILAIDSTFWVLESREPSILTPFSEPRSGL